MVYIRDNGTWKPLTDEDKKSAGAEIVRRMGEAIQDYLNQHPHEY